jgi:AraC-like DNA-binding protein
MAKRAEEITINPFLAADGVATRLAIRELNAAGIDPGPLLAKAGVSHSKFAEEPKRISAVSQLRFLELAAAKLDNAVLGLQLAQRGDLREGGVLYYVMASSHNLGEAVRNLVRYLTVANESLHVVVSEHAGSTILTIHYWLPRHIDRHFAEFAVAIVLRGFRKITGKHLCPDLVTFVHGRNANVAEIDRYFGCPVEFGAGSDTMVFPTALLSTPIPTSDTYLLKILKDHCESMLAERGKVSSALRAMVENEIVQLLPYGKAHIEAVASNLGMSKRTLSRRLSQEGASYSTVLDELRRDLSMQYLKDHNLSLNQISWLLGYSEVTSLNHAFKRWTGESPKSIRAGGSSGDRRGEILLAGPKLEMTAKRR